jgi:hypothetical protein
LSALGPQSAAVSSTPLTVKEEPGIVTKHKRLPSVVKGRNDGAHRGCSARSDKGRKRTQKLRVEHELVELAGDDGIQEIGKKRGKYQAKVAN